MAVDLKGLQDNARKTAIEELSARLADASALLLALKQAHWNIKGRNFIAVHELFDEVYARVEDNIDEMAERIQQLDGVAKGTAEHVAEASSLEPYPLDLTRAEDHIAAVTSRMRDLGGKTRASIETVEDAGEAAGVDILTDMLRDLDKDTWFIESHLEG